MLTQQMKNETLDFYDNNAQEVSDRYEAFDFCERQSNLMTLISDCRKILEIGCGSGRDAAFLLSKGFDITAIDGSRPMLDEAAKRHPELTDRLHQHKMPAALPFPDGNFDAVVSNAMLMHLNKHDIERAISETCRVLKKGGLFYFSVSTVRPEVDSSDHDGTGRRFTNLPASIWIETCRSQGYKKKWSATNPDSGGRGIFWANFLFEKG